MSNKGTKKTYKYKIELPTNFVEKVGNIALQYSDLDKDRFFLFIDLINRKAIHHPKKNMRGEWARLKAEYIKNFIGYKYKEYVKILMDNNIINRTYYTEGKSFDYSINYPEADITEFRQIELNRKLQSKILKEYTRPTKKAARVQYDILKSKSFKFDAVSAYKWVNSQTDLTDKKIIAYNSSITHLSEKNIFVVTADESGRNYHNFNLIKSDLRQYCTLDNETLTGIDLKSSQPYLLASMMLKEYPDNMDIKKFYDIVTKDDIYLWMLRMFYNSYPNKSYKDYVYNEIYDIWICQDKYITSRDNIKPEFLKVLFKDNRGSTPFQDIFKVELPDVFDYIRKKKFKKKNTLAIELQKAESDIFITTANKLYENGVKAITVHDSIYCKESDKEKVIEVLRNEFNIRGYKDYVFD